MDNIFGLAWMGFYFSSVDFNETKKDTQAISELLDVLFLVKEQFE